jgi:hypothetical protein
MVKNFTILMFHAARVALGNNEMSIKLLFQNFNELRKYIQKILRKPEGKVQSERIILKYVLETQIVIKGSGLGWLWVGTKQKLGTG